MGRGRRGEVKHKVERGEEEEEGEEREDHSWIPERRENRAASVGDEWAR